MITNDKLTSRQSPYEISLRGVESAPVEDPSQTTDQPGGREQGQGKPTVISSKASPENNATSKAEYTNTQQGLPVNGYTLVHLTRYARLTQLNIKYCFFFT